MANKHFFDRLKDKMAELQPSEQHRGEDWVALGDRLDAMVPQKKIERKRAIVLPLLLLTALLSSNAMWWHSNRQNQIDITELKTTVSHLENSIGAISAQAPSKTDTIYRIVYKRLYLKDPESSFRNVIPTVIEPRDSRQELLKNSTISQLTTPDVGIAKDTVHADESLYLVTIEQNSFQTPIFKEFDTTGVISGKTNLKEEQPLILDQIHAEKTIEPVGQSGWKALRPKFLVLGGNVGWLFASSPGLMHEGGFATNLRTQIGFSSHWSVTAEFGLSRIHYKAKVPEAILGFPVLPVLDMDHYFGEMDVSRQRIHHFEFGIRYTFAKPGNIRPYLCLGWGIQNLQTFTIMYEVLHEPTGNIQKNVFEVNTRTRLKNNLGVRTGIEIPMTSRLDMTMEGFYQRQLKKLSNKAPDLTGVSIGLNWHF